MRMSPSILVLIRDIANKNNKTEHFDVHPADFVNLYRTAYTYNFLFEMSNRHK